MSKYLIVLGGPTAVGKTSLAIKIAKHFNTDILSCDSRQFYKEMTIGTAVPSEEEQSLVKHHFIHNINIKNAYSVGNFEKDALTKIESIHKEKKLAFMVGGSGLYMDAVCNGFDDFPKVPKKIRDALNLRIQKEGIQSLAEELLKIDPDYYKVVDKANPHRIIRALEVSIVSGSPFSSFQKKKKKKRKFKTLKIILNRDRKELHQRINQRVDEMIKDGLLDEAMKIMEFKHYNALQTVGYKELFAYLDGKWDFTTAVEEIKKNTRRYAKRQLTWFRKDPNNHFFHPSKEDEIIKFIEQHIK